jgi:hypothetical protein
MRKTSDPIYTLQSVHRHKSDYLISKLRPDRLRMSLQGCLCEEWAGFNKCTNGGESVARNYVLQRQKYGGICVQGEGL